MTFGVQDEREEFVREFVELHHKLKALINHQQPLLGENESGENDNSPLLEMIKECSLFVKLALRNDYRLRRQ